MKIARIAALTTVVTAAALLSGCAAPAEPTASDDILNIALSDAIDSWNPQEALASASFSVFPQVFGSLLDTSPDGSELEPGLATEYEFDDDALTITFHLDPDAKFSDGVDVTPDDVIYSEGLWAAGALYGSYFTSIDAVTSPDPDTVVFALNRPDHSLLGILATSNAAIVPADLGGADPETFWKKPISTGAYAIESEDVGESIVLTSNPHYMAHKDRPATVKYSVIEDGAQQLLQFQSGEIDIVNQVELSSASQFDQALLQSTESSGVSTLMFQTAVAPFDDVNFRKAVALAINYDDLIVGGYADLATKAETVLPQTVPGVAACDTCAWGSRDVDEAKRLVEESSYDGSDITLYVKSGAGADQLAAQALVPMLAEAGITVTVEPMALSSYVEKLGAGDFQMGVLTYNALAPSAVDPLGFLAVTGVLFTQSDPAQANAALDALTSSKDDAETEAATGIFEKWAFENTPVVPLAVPDAIYAVSSHVKGFTPNHYRSWSVKNVTLD
ncbi:ABC transporter substrate-binding protein [Microbacterium saperdae]